MFAKLSGGHSIRTAQQAVELRHQRLYLRNLARMLAAHFSTVAWAINRLRLGLT